VHAVPGARPSDDFFGLWRRRVSFVADDRRPQREQRLLVGVMLECLLDGDVGFLVRCGSGPPTCLGLAGPRRSTPGTYRRGVTLFDDIDRSDRSPRRYDEDSFSFYNRAAGVHWQRIREALEEWFEAYPDEHKAALRGHFQPEVPGSTSHPDFAALRHDRPSGSRARARPAARP